MSKPVRSYATSQAGNKTCFFKCDYSFFHNHQCLGCKFCYRLISTPYPPKRISPGYIESEKTSNKHLYKVPITVSRYCEPFLNELFTKNSLHVIVNILENNGQVIIRTSQANLPEEIYSLIDKYKEKIMLQFKVAFHTSISASVLKKELCPGYSSWSDIKKTIEKLDTKHIAILFDPYMIGLNSQSDINNVVIDMAALGLEKLIVSQLFSTYHYRSYLLNTNREIGLKLQESVGDYFTYDNISLLLSLLPTIELCNKHNINLSMCNNKHINQVLGLSTNCCLFDNPDNMYDPNGVRITTRLIPGK